MGWRHSSGHIVSGDIFPDAGQIEVNKFNGAQQAQQIDWKTTRKTQTNIKHNSTNPQRLTQCSHDPTSDIAQSYSAGSDNPNRLLYPGDS